MGRQKPSRDDEKIPAERRGCLVPYLLSVLLTLCLIAYGALLVASRTDGFRSYIEKRVEQVVGMPVSVERVKATPSLSLVIERIVSRDGLIAGKPGLQVGRATVEWRLSGLVRSERAALESLELDDVYLSFAAERGRGWEPSGPAPAAARIAEWLGVFVPAAAVTAQDPKQKPVVPDPSVERWVVNGPCRIRNARVVWSDAEGELAQVSGLEADSIPLAAGRREMQYHFVTAESASRRGGVSTNGVCAEFIQAGGKAVPLE